VPFPPFASAVNDTWPNPAHPVAFAGGTFPGFIGAPTAKVVTVVVTEPQRVVNTARYFSPF
jgi:hypothetical protein